MKLWSLAIYTTRVGQRGNKLKPFVTNYVVMAESREAALEAFKAELPAQIGDDDKVYVLDRGDSVVARTGI